MAGKLDRSALVSVATASGLLAIATVRILSYSRASGLDRALIDSPLGWLAYDPDSFFSVRVFKLVATPTVVAAQYLIFRALNWAHMRSRPPGYDGSFGRIDFRSPWVRLVLTTLVSVHWIAIEWYKFNADAFYPSSPLEHALSNAIVLLASQMIAFVWMRQLSFDPLWTTGSSSPADGR